ncbi:MAG: sigma-70 family RNA polymerase sigma factor [Myxococcales bacterium]|nr:sigma-70 family RNA polymerase sigma factor [Myxococcales bacterium]
MRDETRPNGHENGDSDGATLLRAEVACNVQPLAAMVDQRLAMPEEPRSTRPPRHRGQSASESLDRGNRASAADAPGDASIETSDERELLAAWRAGDRHAGASLFRRCLPTLRRFFDARCRDDAEDLVQQTLVAFLRGAESYVSTSGLRAYLVGVARNRLFDQLRDARWNTLDDSSLVSIASPADTPAQELRRAQRDAIVRQCMQCLPEELRSLLELHYWEGLRMVEIAATLDVPLGTAKSRLRLAKARFAEVLRTRCATAPGGIEDFRP